MVERQHRSRIAATFYAPGTWGERVELSDDASHHARVKRLAAGDLIRLTGGDGRLAHGTLSSIGKHRYAVDIEPGSASFVEALPEVHLHVPIGDRDRMLILAEKAVELGATSWRPVMFARSRSVSPRGEGASFHLKVLARQIGALEQSGSAWLPAIEPDVEFDALKRVEGRYRLLLDHAGESISAATFLAAPVSIVVGPEGGLEEQERDEIIQAGWQPVSLGANVLRYETAGIAALAIVRAVMSSSATGRIGTG